MNDIGKANRYADSKADYETEFKLWIAIRDAFYDGMKSKD